MVCCWFCSVLFCGLEFWGFFSEEVKICTRCFSVALEVFSGKIIEELNLSVALQWHPGTVKSCLEQQAPVNTARRKLMMEGRKVGSHGADFAGVGSWGDTLPLQACYGATPAHP